MIPVVARSSCVRAIVKATQRYRHRQIQCRGCTTASAAVGIGTQTFRSSLKKEINRDQSLRRPLEFLYLESRRKRMNIFLIYLMSEKSWIDENLSLK